MTVIIHIITPDYFWYLANGKCPGQLQSSWREVWSRVAGAEQTVRGVEGKQSHGAGVWCLFSSMDAQDNITRGSQCCRPVLHVILGLSLWSLHIFLKDATQEPLSKKGEQ